MSIKKVLVVLSVFFLILPASYGVGIGLFVEEVNFEPNLNQDFNAFINNNMGYDAKVKLMANGELAKYITFSNEYMDIPVGGRSFFTFNLKLPADKDDIPPGRNRVDIGVLDVTPTSGKGITAKTAAYIGFYVRVPYPGKYIEASFNVKDIGENEILNIDINLVNRGDETIERIEGTIDLFAQGNKIAILSLDPITDVKGGESRTMQTKWDSKSQSSGEYSAKANINYDDNSLTLDTTFKIGTLFIKIINYTKEFYKNEINKFDIEIESLWNTNIDDIYGEVEVDEENVKTLKTNLAPWGRTKITAYLDTTNLAVGIHDVSIKVHYAGKVTTEVGKITILPQREKVVELPSQISPMMTLLIVIIILLVLGNVILILYLIRHEKRLKNIKKGK